MLKASKESKQQFANRVKTLRAQRSIKAAELARSTGVSPASVWQWEHAGAVPRRVTLFKLASALHVSPDYLLKGGRGAPQSAAHQAPAPQSAAPSITPVTTLDDAPLEDLVKAIRAKGFKVILKTV